MGTFRNIIPKSYVRTTSSLLYFTKRFETINNWLKIRWHLTQGHIRRVTTHNLTRRARDKSKNPFYTINNWVNELLEKGLFRMSENPRCTLILQNPERRESWNVHEWHNNRVRLTKLRKRILRHTYLLDST